MKNREWHNCLQAGQFFLRTHHRGTKQCFSNHHIFLFKTADINDCLQCKERISCVSILPAIITLLLAWQWKYSIREQRPNLQQGLNVSSPNPTIDNTVIMALCEASVRLRSYLIINAVWTLWWPWGQSAMLYNRITPTGQLSLPFFWLWHTGDSIPNMVVLWYNSYADPLIDFNYQHFSKTTAILFSLNNFMLMTFSWSELFTSY